jgi:hypothetical protein
MCVEKNRKHSLNSLVDVADDLVGGGDVGVKHKVVVEHLLAMDLHLLVSPDMVLHLDMMTL